MSKIYFIEGDTDSLYYAISGNTDEDYHQGFKHVIKDEIFYKENVYKWFPNPIFLKMS
jgi:DNA polymerase elongation subunit (family B)